MSVTTNIVTKLKQMFYNCGDNANSVSNAVDEMNDIQVTLQIPNGTDGNASSAQANSFVCFTLPVDSKLVGCNFNTRRAIYNAAANTVLCNVTVNTVAAVSFNSDALAATVAANAVSAFTVNTVNSFLDAGEVCIVDYANQTIANNFLDGIMTLTFRRQ